MTRPIPLRPDPAALAARSVEALTRVIITKAQARFEKRSDEASLCRELWPNDAVAPFVLRAATTPTAFGTGWPDGSLTAAVSPIA